MMEAGYVFDRQGRGISLHLPQDRSSGYLPDSRALWQFLWDYREDVGGFIHTHPWDGEACPSWTDVTTFAAIETGLGRRLIWPIATFTDLVYLEWTGPERLDYRPMRERRFRLEPEEVKNLRELSR